MQKTKEELIAFENELADLFKQGKILTPIHLGGDNEEQLINIFKDVKKDDWILCTWRNHYQWLLSGRSPEVLKAKIMNVSSMHVFDDHFFTSAIVGGIAPIAVGLAWAIKRGEVGRLCSMHRDYDQNCDICNATMTKDTKVWCFLGDMGASTGIAMESMRYACGHNLPVVFVIEDNGLSVRTDTKQAWGCGDCERSFFCTPGRFKKVEYKYNRKYNHAGVFINGTQGKILF